MSPGPIATSSWISVFSWLTAENIEKYQELIGTLVGFAGVMLTLWWNAKLERDRHLRSTEQKRNTVIVALCAELEQSSEWIDNQFLIFDEMERLRGPDGPEHSLQAPLNEETPIYDSHIQRLGNLTPQQVAPIMAAYSGIKSRGERLKSVIVLRIGAAEVRGGFITVPPICHPMLRAMLNNDRERINLAISALKNLH